MAQKRRSSILAIALLLTFFAVGAYLSARVLIGERIPLLARGRVAVLPVEGPILSERAFLRSLTAYRDRTAVEAFVLEIRSPGGTVGASQAIYRTVRRLREEEERPVVAWIGDVGASGGYYVALAADSIYALPGSITGSIGVIMEFPNAAELLRKVGVGLEVVKSGEHKDLGSPVRPLTPSDREVIEEMIDDVYAQFVDAVTQNRGLARDSVVRLADGRIFSGERALELGLVDGIGTLDEAIEVAGRMAGLGDRPATVRPSDRERLTLLDLITGVSKTDLRGLVETVRGIAGASPRLLYEWR